MGGVQYCTNTSVPSVQDFCLPDETVSPLLPSCTVLGVLLTLQEPAGVCGQKTRCTSGGLALAPASRTT